MKTAKKGINAAAWFATQSFVSSAAAAPKPELAQPRMVPVERWVDGRWVEVMVPNPQYVAGPRVCCNCKTTAARWDSIYCSDQCKAQFLSFKEEK